MSTRESGEFTRRTLLKGIVTSGVALTVGKGNANAQHVGDQFSAPSDAAFVISPTSKVVIIPPPKTDSVTGIGNQRLSNYIQRVTGVQPQIISAADQRSVPTDACVIRFSQSSIPYFRPDGYEIWSGHEQGRAAVRITATSPAGLKYASYRLIRETRQNGRMLRVPPLALRVNPWLKTRELFVADLVWRNPTESEKKRLPELQKKFDWPNWDISRLEQYVDLVDAMGYNSLMLSDPNMLFAFSGGFASSIDQITRKVAAMYRRAHHNGMKTSFFLWGQQGLGAMVEDVSIGRNNPYLPADLADIESHWVAMIDQFGPLVDRWVVHWADPGGCKAEGCTIRTPQELTNRFASLLSKKGYRSDVCFSLWGLRWGNDAKSRPWPGYIDWTTVLDSGVLSPDIGICMMRRYVDEQAKEITRQSRKAGVWGWYLNDIETNPGMHFHGQILQNEFRRIDQRASPLLDWYSLEDNNHGLNPPSVYVGAQMLWDSETPATKALDDFCSAVWGRDVAPNVAQALQAIGSVRCGAGQRMLNGNLWPDDFMCWFGKGSSSPARDVEVCEKAFQAIKSIRFNHQHIPQLPLVVEPDELLAQVRSHLVYVLSFARIRLAYQEALRPAREGRLEDTQRQMAALPQLPDFIPGSYGAGQETDYCQYLRKFVDSWKGRTFQDNLALRKKVTASSWFNDDPRFAPQNAVNGVLCDFEEEGWSAESQSAAWLKIDLGSIEMIQSVRIYNRGYKRETWDNNLTATPVKASVFYATNDADPSRGTSDSQEAGYERLGGFDHWPPTDDPSVYKEIRADNSIAARFIKIVIDAAANNQRVGCGEVEVRRT